MSQAPKNHAIKDSEQGHWVNRAPKSVRPYLQLSRLDRPVGYWLLALPGWIGLGFASLSHGLTWTDLKWAALILIGAIAMRGAGCTFNDIVDQDLDAQVERTALRPLPAGTVTNKQAWMWVFAQCFIGLMVLLCLPRLAQIISLCSLPLVAAYPFMKRITWWPQVWLGMTFNWAVLVAYAAKTGELSPPLFILYLGLIFWTIGYDTIYACQDIEDDAMVGIKSTARRFGSRVKLGVGFAYSLALICISIALFFSVNSAMYFPEIRGWYHRDSNPMWVFLVIVAPFAMHLFSQIPQIDLEEAKTNLSLFKSNAFAGFILMLAFILYTLYCYADMYRWLGFTDTDLSVFQ